MTRFVAVLSGKGGVGKTTTAINLGAALTTFGRDILVLDANLSTPNVSLHLGSPMVPVTFHDVLDGKNHVSESIYMHSSGLKIIPGDINYERSKNIDVTRLKEVLSDLVGVSEVVFVDCAPGITNETSDPLKHCDDSLIVVNPNLSSVTDGLKAIKLSEELGVNVIGVILNRAREDEIDMEVGSIEALLEKPVVAIIPEDDSIRRAQFMKHPVCHSHPDSPAAISYKKLAAALIGETYIHNIEKEKRSNVVNNVLDRLGLSK